MKKRILLVGIGGVGGRMADDVAGKVFPGGASVFSVALDTDNEALGQLQNAVAVSLSANEALADTLDRLGAKVTNGWFPENGTMAYGARTEMDRGAGLFRMKAAVAYADFTESENRVPFEDVIEEFIGRKAEKTAEEPASPDAEEESTESEEPLSGEKKEADAVVSATGEAADAEEPEEEQITMTRQEGASLPEDERNRGDQEEDPAEEIRYEVYVAASLAGGTGSALFLPVMLDIRSRLAGTPAAGAAYYAMLTTPEIYAFSGTELEKTKMYGNAYAAMRELLAAISLSPKERERLQKWICTRFRPMVDAMEQGQLFRFAYLFGRVPGIFAPDAYERMMADAFSAFASGMAEHPIREEDSPKDAVFAEISLSELAYPAERITEYAVLRATSDLINKNLEFYRSAVGAIASGIGKPYRGYVADAFLDVAVGREDFTDLFPYVKSPTKDFPYYDGEKIVSCLERLQASVGEWTNLLPESDKQAKKQIQSLKMPRRLDSDRAKKQKYTAVTETAQECRRLLEDGFREAFDGFREEVFALADAAMAPRGGAGAVPSVADAILTENGRALHPATAVLRLCSLQKAIADLTPARTVKRQNETEDEYVTRLLSSVQPSHAAQSLGEDERLFALSVTEPAAYALSKADMRKDVAMLFAEWQRLSAELPKLWEETRRAALLGLIESRVEEILEKIPSAFRRYLRETELLSEDVKTARTAFSKETESGVFTASSVREKDAVYARIRAELPPSLSETEEAALFDAWFCSLTDEEKKILPDLVAFRRSAVESCDTYRDVMEKGVFRAVRESLDDDADALLGVTFGKAAPGFGYDEVTARIGGASSSVRFLVGKDAAKELDETAEDESAQAAAVNAFLQSHFVQTAGGEISPMLPARRALAIGTVYGLRFSDFPVLREGTSGGLWYAEYVKSYSMQNRYNTAMWSSHIFSNAAVQRDLPFVRKEMQDDRQRARVRALLGLMTEGRFTVVDSEIAPGTFVYGDILECGAPLSFPDGREIPEGDYAALYQWVLQDDERVAAASEKYEKRLAEWCRRFTTVAGILCPAEEIARSVSKTPMFCALSGNLLGSFPKTGKIPTADVFDVIAPFTGSEKQIAVRDAFLWECSQVIVLLCACRKDSCEEDEMPEVIREAIALFAEGHPAAKKKMLAFALEE